MSVIGSGVATPLLRSSGTKQMSPFCSSKRCVGSSSFQSMHHGSALQAPEEVTLAPLQAPESSRQSAKPGEQLVRESGNGAKFEVLGKLLRNSSVASCMLDACPVSCGKGLETGGRKDGTPSLLPRDSPHIGFQRHAPPSPMLSFFSLPPALDPKETFASLVEDACGEDELGQSEEQLVSWHECVPLDIWERIFSAIISVPSLHNLSHIARGFPLIIRSPGVWKDRNVRIAPNMLQALAPRLSSWLPSWRFVSNIILPNSQQMLVEIARRSPDIPVAVAWRFSDRCKGDGVEVLRHGRTVRRIGDEELVVIGDAPIAHGKMEGREADIWASYFEVRLDKLDMLSTTNPNDFGLGVTGCHPVKINPKDVCVADEVPRSWIVDFTRSSVVLTRNNDECVIGNNLSASCFVEGDRVGLRIVEDAVEIFVNGLLRERLVPDRSDRVPVHRELFPVLDLYGRTVQISRVDVEMPMEILYN